MPDVPPPTADDAAVDLADLHAWIAATLDANSAGHPLMARLQMKTAAAVRRALHAEGRAAALEAERDALRGRVRLLQAVADAARRYQNTIQAGMKVLHKGDPDWKEKFVGPADQTAAAWAELKAALGALDAGGA